MFVFNCSIYNLNKLKCVKFHIKNFLYLIMKKAVNRFLSKGDKFTPEMNLKQPKYTQSSSVSYIKKKERYKDLKSQEM